MARPEKQPQPTVDDALKALEEWLRGHQAVTQQLLVEVDRRRKENQDYDDRHR